MSEFKPTPSPEISTEAKEKEAGGIEIAKEIASLRATARSDADYEAILQKTRELRGLFYSTEAKLSGEVTEQMRKAEEIIGKENFVGPTEIQNAFGFEPKLATVPEIPFSESDLEKAKELDQMLILRVGEIPTGEPMTMKAMNELLSGKLKDGNKVLYDTDWYKDQEFYTTETVKAGWALVSKEEIPNSTSKNYLEQTEAIVNYLQNSIFAGESLPSEYQEAVDEFESQKDEIAGLIESDWQAAAERLSNLSITSLTRQTPVEAIYDLVAHYQNADERLLSNMCTWTSRRSSGGYLVYVGDFESDGVSVDDAYPDTRYGAFGVSFSRSQ